MDGNPQVLKLLLLMVFSIYTTEQSGILSPVLLSSPALPQCNINPLRTLAITHHMCTTALTVTIQTKVSV